jgi:hypothetical protein
MLIDHFIMKNDSKTWGYVFSWIFGIAYLAVGISNIVLQPTLSIALLILGLFLLPPVNLAIDKKWSLDMTNRVRLIFLGIFIVIGTLIIANMCSWFYCAS